MMVLQIIQRISVEYVEKDSRFRYFEKKMEGLSDAHVMELDNQKGSSYFVDSDIGWRK